MRGFSRVKRRMTAAKFCGPLDRMVTAEAAAS
jgi:hypothetical protein